MELSRYTDNAVTALSNAQAAARTFGHSFVGSEHLLIGLIKCTDNTSRMLEGSGVTEEKASPYVDTVVGRGRNIFTDSFGYTQSAKRILELALYEAKASGSSLVGTEHILLSIMRERDCIGARIIDALCYNKDALRSALINGGELPTENLEDEDLELYEAPKRGKGISSSTPVLNTYTRDLTELAKKGKLDPVIGRDTEISRVLRTLCRRTKNNPVLIGEPGVGKSAVAEGIAQKLVADDVPDALSGSRLLSLDLTAMIAGTRYRGEFEERLKNTIDELSKNPDIILFIDELHTIVGAGSGEGSIDAANIMKPALARGELRVIGATTVSEYRKYIEKDPALERRFTPIFVDEPSAEQTKVILSGLKDKYELHHGVSISDEAITLAVELSVRFITDRQLPDKAIDILDEACARARILASSDSAERQAEEAAAKGDYEEAERLLNCKKSSSAHPVVEASDVYAVIAEKTGLDAKAYSSGAMFSDIEERLKESIFGQNDAVSEVAAILKRAYAGLSDPNKPLASFVFCGPSSVGKEALARELAKLYFGGAILVLNAAELDDEHAVARLIGSPTGYKDSEKGGVLTEFLKLHQFSVVLFNSFDKAEPSLTELIRSALTNGVIEDGRGRIVGLRNCVLVFTAEASDSKRSIGFADNREDYGFCAISDAVSAACDAVIRFAALDRAAIKRIVVREFDDLAARATRRNVPLSYSDAAVESITSECGSHAANIKRLVSINAENTLSEALLEGRIQPGDRARLDVRNGKIITEREKI